MENLTRGEWTPDDFQQARLDEQCISRVQNSNKRIEHSVTVQLRSPQCLTIMVENQGSNIIYKIDIKPRDLPVNVYKQASLIWLKLLLNQAVRGEIGLRLSFITSDELKINSIFVKEKLYVPRSVKEEQAYAVLMEVSYPFEDQECTISLQIPKLLEQPWERRFDLERLSLNNSKLQQAVLDLYDENSDTMRQFQESKKQIEELRHLINS